MEDNAYELHAFAYSKEMDQLMLANNIIDYQEESRSLTYPKEGMTEMEDKEENNAYHHKMCKR